MLAASYIRAIPSLEVDSGPNHEVALIYSRRSEFDATNLLLSLRRQGHRARLVPASPQACSQTLRAGGPPVLLVATSDEIDTPVLRSRLARELEREHSWLDRTRAGCGHALYRQICARMNTLRCEETIEAPFVPRLELVEPEVIDRSPSPTPPQPKRPFRANLLVWPLVGALTTALGMLAFRPNHEEAQPQTTVREPAVERSITADPIVAPPVVRSKKPAPLPRPPRQAAAAVAEPDAGEHDRVTAVEGVLVYVASERPRDWYTAMNLCRARTLGGARGWKTPSTKQLNALAKARVLPPGSLWSRTRALNDEDVAFVVHGRAGTIRRAIKSETIDLAVCVRTRSAEG